MYEWQRDRIRPLSFKTSLFHFVVCPLERQLIMNQPVVLQCIQFLRTSCAEVGSMVYCFPDGSCEAPPTSNPLSLPCLFSLVLRFSVRSNRPHPFWYDFLNVKVWNHVNPPTFPTARVVSAIKQISIATHANPQPTALPVTLCLFYTHTYVLAGCSRFNMSGETILKSRPLTTSSLRLSCSITPLL